MASRRQQIACLFLLQLQHCCLSQTVKPPSNSDPAFIKDVVDEHNKLRSQVTPTATNMRYMGWDKHLAITSEGWAKKCIDSESVDTETIPGMADPNLPNIGQNIWIGNYTTIASVIQTWASEGKNYMYADNSCSLDRCDHYKKMVWAGSFRVGCGAASCERIQYYNRGTDLMIVACFYAPSAKLEEQDNKPYIEGKSCTQCPAEYKCDNNLCRNDEIDAREGTAKGSSWNPRWATYGWTAFVQLPFYSAIFNLLYCVT